MVYAAHLNGETSKKNIQNSTSVYMTHLRQYYVTTINLVNNCSAEFIPFISFNSPDDEENQSRRLLRPILTGINPANNLLFQQQQTYSLESASSRMTKNSNPSFSAAGQSMRQSLSRANLTLQQIREASSEVFLPAPESQLSFKPMTPKAEPLPPHLALQMSRSKPLN